MCGMIWIGFFVILAGILFGVGYGYYRKWKVMAETPTRMIVDIEPGRVEVNGIIEAIPGRLFHSPMTSTPCVHYKVEVQEYRSSGKSHYWATIHKNERGNSFLVSDESGKVLIDPRGANLEKVQTMNSRKGMFDSLDQKATEYIRMAGIKEKGFFGVFNRTLRVIETVIPAGQTLYVLGDARELPLEPVLENDPMVSPFTIKKKGIMILSYDSEKVLSNKKKSCWIAGFITAVISMVIGIIGFFYFSFFFI